MTINSNELTANLKSCSATFVEKLIVSFGDEAIKDLENTSTLQAKRELLEVFILDNEDEIKAEMIAESIEDFAKFVQKNEADLKASKEALDNARKTYNEDRQKYETNTFNKIEALDKEFEIDKDKLAAQQLAQNKLRAKKLREKARHRGLVSIAKGAVAATIDGIENEYFKVTTAVVTKTIQEAKTSMTHQQEAGVDVDTLESYKSIEEFAVSNAKKTTKNTNGGKNVAILSATMDSTKATAALRLDLSSESLAKLEKEPRELHEQRIRAYMNSQITSCKSHQQHQDQV